MLGWKIRRLAIRSNNDTSCGYICREASRSWLFFTFFSKSLKRRLNALLRAVILAICRVRFFADLMLGIKIRFGAANIEIPNEIGADGARIRQWVFRTLFGKRVLYCAANEEPIMNRSLWWIFTVGWAALAVNGWAQRPANWCAIEEKTQELLTQDPHVMERVAEYVRQRPQLPAPEGTVRIIPVVVHVLHDGDPDYISDEKIEEAIDRLNLDFRARNSDTNIVRAPFKHLIADMEIEFRLARRDYRGYCTNGIVREYNTATNGGSDRDIKKNYWPTNKYLNIYVVKSIGNRSGGTVLGYAYYPQTAAGQRHDGVVIRADEMHGFSRTLTHEVGHYLGLAHTFEGGCSLAGDGIDDTPPVADPNWGCPWSRNSCSIDSPDLPDMIENYMDYSDCQALFTHGQKQRVDALFPTYRAELSSQANLQLAGVFDDNYTCRPLPRFEPERSVVCSGEPIQIYNRSLYKGTPSFQWELNGATPSTSSDKEPTVTYSQPGVYPISLTITQNGETSERTNARAVTVVPDQPVVTGPWMHQIAPVMPEWMFVTNANGNRWEVTSKAAFSGTHSIFFHNFRKGTDGEQVDLLLPPVDMTALDAPILRFKYAHARRDAKTQDLLMVYASPDCGKTWHLRWFGGGSRIASIGGVYLRDFYPKKADEWDSVEVNLGAYSNTSHLLVRLSFRSGKQNNIFVDDIQFGRSPTIISGLGGRPDAGWNVTVRNRTVYVEGGRRIPRIEVFSADGRLVERLRARSVALDRHPAGIYWVRISDRGRTIVQRIALQ